LRVPGIGAKGAYKIVAARRHATLTFADLKKMRIVLKRARHFITCAGKFYGLEGRERVSMALTAAEQAETAEQLSLFEGENALRLPVGEKEIFALKVDEKEKKFLLSSTPEIARSALLGEL
jgi:hypothetical protein